jgi:hypothetical protein
VIRTGVARLSVVGGRRLSSNVVQKPILSVIIQPYYWYFRVPPSVC